MNTKLLISVLTLVTPLLTHASETTSLLRSMALAAADSTASPSSIRFTTSPSPRHRSASVPKSTKTQSSLRHARRSLDMTRGSQESRINLMSAFGVSSASSTTTLAAPHSALPSGMDADMAATLGVITAPSFYAGAGAGAAAGSSTASAHQHRTPAKTPRPRSINRITAHNTSSRTAIMNAFGIPATTAPSSTTMSLPVGMEPDVAAALGLPMPSEMAPHAGAGAGTSSEVRTEALSHGPRHRSASIDSRPMQSKKTAKIFPAAFLIADTRDLYPHYAHVQQWIQELKIPSTEHKIKHAPLVTIPYGPSHLDATLFLYDGTCYAYNGSLTFKLTSDGFQITTLREYSLLSTEHKTSLKYSDLQKINAEITKIDRQYTLLKGVNLRFKMFITINKEGSDLSYLLSQQNGVLYATKVEPTKHATSGSETLENSLFHLLLHSWDRNPEHITITEVRNRQSCVIS